MRAIQGDCIAVLQNLILDEDLRVDAVICDPPYHLTSIVKRFGKEGSAPARFGKDGAFSRASAGFCGMSWDGGDIAFRADTWRLVYEAMKPGAYLLAFGGTRTYHRMACAIEDAGFEIRDCIFWHYGSGFPKSHDISRKLRASDECCSCAENVRGVQQPLGAEKPVPSSAESNLWADLSVKTSEYEGDGQAVSQQPTSDDILRGLRDASDNAAGVAPQSQNANLLKEMQRVAARAGVGDTRAQRQRGAKEYRQAVRAGESCLEGRDNVQASEGQLQRGSIRARSGLGASDGDEERLHRGTPSYNGADVRVSVDSTGVRQPQGSESFEQPSEQSRTLPDERGSQAWRGWPICGGCGKPRVSEGLGTALKPATEPIVFARKPIVGTIAENVLRFGTGALNIDACRVPTNDVLRAGTGAIPCRHDPAVPRGRAGEISADRRYKDHGGTTFAMTPGPRRGDEKGRWPANIIHDGSEEVLNAFPDAPGQQRGVGPQHGAKLSVNVYGDYGPRDQFNPRGDSGSAARFFYQAKANKDDRNGSKHPTVKPIALLRYLCRLVTPPGGTILDPFAGSGTLGEAAMLEGFNSILIEREDEYFQDILRRKERAERRVAEQLLAELDA